MNKEKILLANASASVKMKAKLYDHAIPREPLAQQRRRLRIDIFIKPFWLNAQKSTLASLASQKTSVKSQSCFSAQSV